MCKDKMVSEFLNDLEYLVNIDSGSDCPDGSLKIAEFFEERFNDMGWICQKHKVTPGDGTCLVCKNREVKKYDLMLIGHTDTVFAVGTATKRSFKIAGNKAFGPGVSDMKNGCLLMYYVLKNLPKDVTDKLNIVVVFNPDEETGSLGSQKVYGEYAKNSNYAFVFESTSADGTHTVKRKGGYLLKIEFFGKSGHCGNVFTNGALSAVSEMAKWIVAFDELQKEEKDTSVNIIVTSGGKKSNIVPDFAKITVDIRFWDSNEAKLVDELLDKLQKDATGRNIKVNFDVKRLKPAFVPDEKAQKYIEHVKKLAKENDMEFDLKARGGQSDANFISQWGAICIDGLGPSGASIHTDDEYMFIDSIIPSFELSTLLIKDLAQNKKH